MMDYISGYPQDIEIIRLLSAYHFDGCTNFVGSNPGSMGFDTDMPVSGCVAHLGK